jgi:pteridine reductase
MSESPPRVALVTGSGRRRIGWHIADALAGRGYALAVHYRGSAEAAAETVKHLIGRGVESIAFQADLSDEHAARRLVDLTLAHFGRLDLLVNAAAIWEGKQLEQITATDLRRTLDVNLVGTFICAQQAGLAMVAQSEGGCIINFGDWAEARPYTNYAAYFAAKGAIPTLTRCLAVELAKRNPRVRVNAILPGPVMLPAELTEEERTRIVASTLAGREGSPRNIADAVLALTENDYITGISLPVDGGRTIFAGGF